MSQANLQELLDLCCQEQGFSRFGATRLAPASTLPRYRQWLEEEKHGSMSYLEAHLPFKENPELRFPGFPSAFLFAMPYLPHPAPEPRPLSQGRVALYAQGQDYHHWFKSKLEAVCQRLRREYPDHLFEPHTDSSPLLERDLAARAGLGWFGKNTCLIHPKGGSLFLIGEILTSLPVELEITPVPDFCGTCRRCIEICPTQALSEKVLDARRCISYWTIESRELPPENLRSQFGDWLFGCDLCQTVCPWNQKVFGKQLQTSPLLPLSAEEERTLEQELRELLTSSGKSLEKKWKGTPLSRAGAKGLKRNALIVAANRKLKNLEPEIAQLRDHEFLGELARWALERLKLPH